jgi:hypothetical protein
MRLEGAEESEVVVTSDTLYRGRGSIHVVFRKKIRHTSMSVHVAQT